MPIDIVALVSILEALVIIERVEITLRLCHCHGKGALAGMPQEILEEIVSHILQQGLSQADHAPTTADIVQMLKKRFGLQAIIIHEYISDQLFHVLQNLVGGEIQAFRSSFYNKAYWVHPLSSRAKTSSSLHRLIFLRNKEVDSAALWSDESFLDPSSLTITETLRSQFLRCMRSLQIQPTFHLSLIGEFCNWERDTVAPQ